MELDSDENYEGKIDSGDTFETEEEIETSQNNLCFTDLSVLGKIWVLALRTVLVGANFSIIPVVHAGSGAVVPLLVPPKKPPKMRYKDLPIYQSPHADYKDYLESQYRIPDRDVKVLQMALLPYVRTWRQRSINAFCTVCCSVRSTRINMSKAISDSKNDFKRYMRDPSNLRMRQGVVASGMFFGFLLSSGGGIPKRVSFTSLGALATGSLCFPRETDEIFRNVVFNTANLATALYNMACRKDIHLFREKVPCIDELPAGAICN